MDYKTQIIENAKNIAKILSDALKIKELPESTQGIKSDDSIALQRGDETLQAKISELPFASITDIYGLTALIKGGYYNILGTYNYFVWVQEYIINGTYTNFYRSNTLPVETSDLTFDRFDTIIINTAGLLFIRKGVASANPIEPEVDNLTELKIALIFVEANSVAPVGVTEVVVFDEGGGTASGEFDITHAGSVLSAEQSSSGANSLKLVNKSAAFAISTLNYNGSELSNITMKVFLATSTKNALRFSLWNVDDMRVGEVYVNHNDYGFNAYLIGVWQTLSIPSTGFRTADWAALQYNTLWINNNKSGSTVYIDDIKIQQGLSQPTNSNITHTHSNFSLLESITQTLVNSWNAAYNWVNTNGANVLENLANKQNSLATDGTGGKYPTVDAVNAGLATKLDASAYNQHFKGKFVTSAALISAFPASTDGDYATVDAGAGVDAKEWIWDTEAGWIVSSAAAAGTTDSLTEGSTNLYFTAARVLATVLTGISFITNRAVTAADSLLVAIGLLQKQITDLISGKQNKLTAGTNITIDNTDPLNPVINAAGGGSINPPVHIKYTTQALMIADQVNQVSGYIYFDATYYYEYLGTVLGTIADYKMLGGDMTLAGVETVNGLKTFLYDKLGLRNAANTFTSFFRNANTAVRYYTLPDKTGTVAMTSDIVAQMSGVVNYLVKFGTATTGVVSRLWDTGTFFGIGTVNSPLKDITLGNQANREIGIELSNSTTKGRDLIVSAGKTVNYQLNTEFIALEQVTRNWTGLTATLSGNVYAASRGGDIYMQTNGVGNFVALGQTSRDWVGMSAAPNGNVYAVTGGDYSSGDIYMQTNGVGNFVALGQTSRTWTGITCASNGDVYAAVLGGDIYMQTNGVGNFVALGQISRNWFGIAYAPNGNIYATVRNGDIYMQTNGVGNFVGLGQTSRYWIAIACAPNGNVYATIRNGDIYMQTNGVGNFVALGQTSRDWVSICSDVNGNIYAGVGQFSQGYIYMQNNDAVGAADLDGGTLIQKAGTGKGTGKSRYEIWTGQKTASGTDMQTETLRTYVDENGYLVHLSTPIYADNTAALAGGLVVGTHYRTATGISMIVY